MYDYNYLDSMGFMGLLMGFMGGILIIFAIIELAILALTIVGRWKVFEKARQPGWAGIVPFYSDYVLYKITWGNGVLFVIPLVLSLLTLLISGGFFHWLFFIANFVVSCLTAYKLSTAFGKGIGFTIALALLNPIFVFILGMSNARYLGIPRDGFSYDEVMNKYNEQKNHVQYQNPTQGQYNQYGYQAPNTPNHTAPNQNTTNAGTNPEGNVQPNQTSQNQNTTGQSSAPADSYDDTHNSFN